MLEGIKDIVGTIFGVGLLLIAFGLAILFFYMTVINFKDKVVKRKSSNNRTRMFCKGCRKIISIDAERCPHCGESYGKSNPVLSSIIFCFIAGCGFLYIGLEGVILFLEDGISQLIP
ncbi:MULTISPECIES: hypothetical protein [Paenibacillus]|uniref:UPF0547 domain-containing protein n=1 Tax=Paenibacillus vandeheii TaxID=3035917 RepID=A0ABT8JHN0_9BACL|nr:MULTISPECIES: hypothetical protein [Paenibacillus]KGP77804.1 hypothetical protein P364_0131600 [Paenibacillus sp. MAEPY2]KGP77931.1 hypothetical protein P363_0132835 [Paenibacillus sp. MAEPY1]MDN4603962.1 hypothetical protein [Paenibacillus vandeheii]